MQAERRDAARVTSLLVLVALLVFAGCARAVGPGRGPAVRFDVAADPANLNPLFIHADAGNVEGQLAHLAFEPWTRTETPSRNS